MVSLPEHGGADMIDAPEDSWSEASRREQLAAANRRAKRDQSRPSSRVIEGGLS